MHVMFPHSLIAIHIRILPISADAHYITPLKRCQVCSQTKELWCQHFCETFDKTHWRKGYIVSWYTTGHTVLPVINQRLPQGLSMHNSVDIRLDFEKVHFSPSVQLWNSCHPLTYPTIQKHIQCQLAFRVLRTVLTLFDLAVICNIIGHDYKLKVVMPLICLFVMPLVMPY